jgi:hypothetical protein
LHVHDDRSQAPVSRRCPLARSRSAPCSHIVKAEFPRMVRFLVKRSPGVFRPGSFFSNYIPSRQTGQERVLPHIFRFTVGTGIPESLFSVVSARDMLKIKEYVFAREAMNSLPESGRS